MLVPATPQGRSIFSRVAMRLGCGMTADCTEVLAAQREDGSFYIKQNKPSYGENVFVTILTKEGIYPQMMTVRPGVYAACEAKESGNANVTFLMISKLKNLELRFWKKFRQKIQQTVFSEQKLLLSEDVEFWKMITLNFLRNLLRKSEEQSEEQDQWLIQRLFRSITRLDRQDLQSVRRSVSPLVCPEQFSIQKESRIQIYMLQSIQTKMLRFLELQITESRQI